MHDRAVDRAEAGQRVAVALPGIERDEISRGDALVAPGAYPVTYRLDVALEELGDVPAAVTVHLGTADVPARVVRKDGYAQLRLARPVVAARGDRVVLRAATTVGGGVVLDPLPPRRLDPERLERLDRGDGERVRARPRVVAHAPRRAGGRRACRRLGLLGRMARGAPAPTSTRRLAAADPRDPGIDPPSEPWAPAIVPLLGLERRGSRLYAPGARSPACEGGDELLAELELAGYNPVKVEDAGLARALEQQGQLVRLGDDTAVGRAAYEQARAALVAECTAAGSITLARFRDLLGIGRRAAQLLLERFDADGLTRRTGDAARPPPGRTLTFWIALGLVVFGVVRGRRGRSC